MKPIAQLSILFVVLATIVILPGCSSGAPVSNIIAKKGTEITLVRKTVQVEPRRVVDQTFGTLNQPKLQNIRPTQTALDAVFECTSARNRNYRVIVTGTGLKETRIEILGLKDYVDKEQANLIYQEIERNLFVN